MRQSVLTTTGLILLAASLAFAAEAAKEETITYTLEDFESFRPGGYGGRREASGGSAFEETTVRNGKRSVRLRWDFTECPDGNYCFYRFNVNRTMIGRPSEIRICTAGFGRAAVVALCEQMLAVGSSFA